MLSTINMEYDGWLTAEPLLGLPEAGSELSYGDPALGNIRILIFWSFPLLSFLYFVTSSPYSFSFSSLSERTFFPFSFFEDFSRSDFPLGLRDFLAGLLPLATLAWLLLLDLSFFLAFSLLSRLLLTDFFLRSFFALLRGLFDSRLLLLFLLLRSLLRLIDIFLRLRLRDFFCRPLLASRPETGPFFHSSSLPLVKHWIPSTACKRAEISLKGHLTYFIR